MATHFPSPPQASAGVILVVVVLGLYALTVVASAASGEAAGRVLLVRSLPLPFYLYALVVAARTIRRIGNGEALKGLVSGLLSRIGWALFAGAIVQVFVVPWLSRTGPGSLAYFDMNAITLGAIGVTLVILARIVRQAEADRAELDSFL